MELPEKKRDELSTQLKRDEASIQLVKSRIASIESMAARFPQYPLSDRAKAELAGWRDALKELEGACRY
ncbi:TPA: hypothetical protein I8637_004302 [Raoultella ornithinolytica]|uniref:hypothetical protein n=1 Tax=Raoultella ornithinolytica TaxID=54291 RepID=UPI001A29F752|nr:hypothetical protein [Raoultella ornithinolytica]ELH1431640.1 hypothetical protein [Raoultella ornithinolytica]HAT3824108.1 hypothetical protein [Raoultella ornithinolytica]HEQ2046486.1 hypothetical protein [Raoultella ornithinolytica]